MWVTTQHGDCVSDMIAYTTFHKYVDKSFRAIALLFFFVRSLVYVTLWSIPTQYFSPVRSWTNVVPYDVIQNLFIFSIIFL